MANNKSTSSVSFLSLLFLTFLILKLCGVIGWSWWWVTSPLWGGFAILAIIALIVVLFGVFVKYKLKRKR